MLDDESLKKIGIDLGLIISGVFGALLMSSNNSLKSSGTNAKSALENVFSVLSSLAAGAASANYLTPVVVDLLSIKDSHYNYGIAFLLGFLGLKGVEALSNRLLSSLNKKEKEELPKPTKRHARSTKSHS